MKQFLILIATAIFLTACTSTTQLAKETTKLMRGNWQISNVNFIGVQSNQVKATVFNQASSQCFVNSQWNFVANNNTGNYQFNNSEANCPNTQTTNFKWFIKEQAGEAYLMFKPIGNNQKAKNITTGYQLKVISSAEDAMVLAQEIMFEGSPITINYTYNKIN